MLDLSYMWQTASQSYQTNGLGFAERLGSLIRSLLLDGLHLSCLGWLLCHPIILVG